MIAPSETRLNRRRMRLQSPRRTPQRLADAQAAFDRGEYTTAVVLARVAIDSAIYEAIGRVDKCDFIRLVTIVAGCHPRTLKRTRNLLKPINAIVHGSRNATRYEAGRILRLTEVLGCRWFQRMYGDAPAPLEAKGGAS